jgi:hypothetical protein
MLRCNVVMSRCGDAVVMSRCCRDVVMRRPKPKHHPGMSPMTRLALAVVLSMGAVSAQPDGDAIVSLAVAGWQAARAAAQSGGTTESLAPAARLLAELDKQVAMSRWPLQGAYARSLVAAAMAAAQEERAELAVHLEHARDLSARLETSTYPAMWPKPFDEAAGELWLEVEHYRDALAAYERAVRRDAKGSSWLGLARSAARLKETSRACEGYRQVLHFAVAGTELEEARGFLARCP